MGSREDRRKEQDRQKVGRQTRQEATRQALVIEANRTGERLDGVVDDLMRAAGWSSESEDVS